MQRLRLPLSVLTLASACAVVTGCVSSDSSDEGEAPIAAGTLTVTVAGEQVDYALKQGDGTYVGLNLDHMEETTWPGSDRKIDWRTAGGSPVEVFGTRNDDGSI